MLVTSFGIRTRILSHLPRPTASSSYTKIWCRKIMYHFSTNLFSQPLLFMIWIQERSMTPARHNLAVRLNSQVLKDDAEALLTPLMKFLALSLTNTKTISFLTMMVLVISKGSMAMENGLTGIWVLLTSWDIKEEPLGKYGSHRCTVHFNPEAPRGEEIEDIYVRIFSSCDWLLIAWLFPGLNLVGSIWTVDQDTHHTVTVEFYDREMHRDFHFTDNYLYDKACLSKTIRIWMWYWSWQGL